MINEWKIVVKMNEKWMKNEWKIVVKMNENEWKISFKNGWTLSV
jgi:hypothetical protein